MAKGALDEAIAKYTEAIALDPQNVNLLASRASTYGRLNLHQAVLHDGNDAVQLIVEAMKLDGGKAPPAGK